MNGGYNLELPSQIAMQGFPALDYLLFGVSDTDDVLNFYQNNEDADKYLDYLNVLTTRINELATVVLDDWNNRFRDEFVQNSGNSALASVDKVVNDFIFYYEKHLRAGKIGIPAGVFSGTTLPENVEAFYNKNFSKTLFNASLDAVQDFFNGVHFDGGNEGESMSNYLEYLDVIKNDKNLAQVINDQFDSARVTAQELSDNFAEQVETDNVKMLATYDQLQLNVVHIKVDMLQAFNVNVDYVDADGD
jgi:predicted lipoprotein